MRDWADFITLPLQAIGVNPRRMARPQNLQERAFHLVQSAELQGFHVADPRGFDDGTDRAFRFNQVVPYERTSTTIRGCIKGLRVLL